nr:MAG TPA: hypothetical protein [Caudoviricetes sp.]
MTLALGAKASGVFHFSTILLRASICCRSLWCVYVADMAQNANVTDINVTIAVHLL